MSGFPKFREPTTELNGSTKPMMTNRPVEQEHIYGG